MGHFIMFMLVTLFFLFNVVNGQEFPPKLPTCITPPNFDRIRSNSKFVVSKKTANTLTQALIICNKDGLNIGNILNREEEEDVEKYIIYESSQNTIFIGGMKEAGKNKIFRDRYGRELSYAHFYENNPNYNGGVNECQFLYVTTPSISWSHLNRTNKALWNDWKCNEPLGIGNFKVLCEFKENTCDLPSQPNKQQLHPLHPSTKYFYSEIQRNWYDSNDDCKSLGKIPVSLSSQTELDLIRLALINSSICYHFIWIGGKSINYETSRDITWEDPKVTTNIAFNFTTDESINPKCVNIAVGNKDNIYSQLMDCSLPMFFLCREKDEDPTTTTTTTSTTYIHKQTPYILGAYGIIGLLYIYVKFIIVFVIYNVLGPHMIEILRGAFNILQYILLINVF